MSTDKQKEDQRRRKANQRARERGEPEPYPKTNPEEIKQRRTQNARDLEWAEAQDATGKFYKSECRSCVDLLAIYEGANILDKESQDEDEETGDGKKKSKKSKKEENRPNPSQQKLTIRAIETNGLLIEPDHSIEFRTFYEVNEVVSFQRWLDLRDKARKNLLWLGRLLGKGLFHSVHQYVCDQFVQKDFDGMYFPDYNLDDFHDMVRAQKRLANDGVTPCREMLLLESRGSYKSTINAIDTVQWFINCPDIRVLFITATRPLAKKSAREIKRYFYLPQKGTPSAFHLLFPEFILRGVDGLSEAPMLCPARVIPQKEDSLWTTSMESTSTGDHCDLKKADDIVVPKNSASAELRQQLKFDFDGIDDILDQWGFADACGTRYFTDDWYGTRALPDEDTGEVTPYKYSCRGCWTLKPEYVLDYKNGTLRLKDITEDMVVLTFPYKLSFKELRKTLNKKGERSFKNQQLNEATDPSVDEDYINQFDIDVLRKHTHAPAGAPKGADVEIYQAWDTAWNDTSTSDFSAGVTAAIYKLPDGRYAACVLEIIFGKWKSSELVKNMVMFYEKWKPKRILIEKVNAAEYIDLAIKQQAILMNNSMIRDSIYWRPVDTQSKAKRNRIKILELLLNEDRLCFCVGLWIDETYKQLTRYTGEHSTSTRKDDIPDALALMLHFFPRGSTPGSIPVSTGPDDPELERRKAMMRAQHREMFGTGSTPQPMLASEWQRRQRGGDLVPVTPAKEQPVDPRRAMLNKLFGGNGMRA